MAHAQTSPGALGDDAGLHCTIHLSTCQAASHLLCKVLEDLQWRVEGVEAGVPHPDVLAALRQLGEGHKGGIKLTSTQPVHQGQQAWGKLRGHRDGELGARARPRYSIRIFLSGKCGADDDAFQAHCHQFIYGVCMVVTA